MFTRILILILLVAAAACAPNPIQTPVQNPTPTQGIVENTEEASPAITATPSPVVEDGLQKKLTQIVRNDLAAQLSTNIEEISVISAEAVVWPNAALGCPAPGKVYAQGTVPGFRIRLEAENNEYSYHTDRTGRFVLCPEENPELQDRLPIPVKPGEIDDGEPWMPVD